jgi:hypothetical protein
MTVKLSRMGHPRLGDLIAILLPEANLLTQIGAISKEINCDTYKTKHRPDPRWNHPEDVRHVSHPFRLSGARQGKELPAEPGGNLQTPPMTIKLSWMGHPAGQMSEEAINTLATPLAWLCSS